jgi:hypothetical protein
MTLPEFLASQDLPADLADISPELLAAALLCHAEKLWPLQIEYLESFLDTSLKEDT